MLQSKIEKYSKEFQEIENDVNVLITQIDTCFDLLIPKFQIVKDTCTAENFQYRPMHGLSFSIILNSKVEITRDSSNSDLIDNLKEFCNELSKFYDGKFCNFYNILNQDLLKVSFETNTHRKLLDDAECLKLKIATIIWKFNEINIIHPQHISHLEEVADDVSKNNEDSDDQEDDFEEVPDREG